MPRLPRFFISPDQVSGSSLTVAGEDVRHIAVVLRMKPGEQITLCDGQGTEFTARITNIGRSEIVTEILGQSRKELPSPRITLAQGLPKSDKMDFIVQKATELGVTGIVPLVTERTVLKLRDEQKRAARWRKIAREAAMQSDRPDIPDIGRVRSLDDFIRSLGPDPGALRILPWEDADEPVKSILRRSAQTASVLVLIGPEGGISSKEAELARSGGFHPVSLGPTILRTETAGVAAISVIRYELQ